MKRKIALKVLALISMMCAGFLVPEMVFALGQGGAVGGGIASGGSCESSSDLWNTCNGYSWQKYLVEKELPPEGVTMSYTKNTNPKGAVYIGGGYCKTGMTIYNYGFEVKRDSLRGYQVSTQSNREGIGTWAAWVYSGDELSSAAPRFKGNLLSGTGNPPFTANATAEFHNGNIQNYTRPDGYATQDEAAAVFDRMHKFIVDNPEQNIPGSDLSWYNVGAFCWYENPEQVFYANSKVEANKVGSSSVHMEETGISEQSKDADTLMVSIKAGESVDIVFTHNLYSKEKLTSNKSWMAKRDFSTSVTMGGDTTKTVRGETQFINLGEEGLRTATNNPVLKDTYSGVKFNNPGQYDFCESITIDSVTTKACVEIRVTTFYASSKVEANKVGSLKIERAETGIVQNKDVSATLSIKVGESANIVFTHNLYSKEKVTSSRSWRAERDFSAGITMGGSTSKTVTGSTKFTGLTTESGMKLYAADRNPVLKDTYSNVKFSNPGNYSFCESVTIDAATTKACVNINVTKDNPGPDPGGGGSNPSQGNPCGFGLPGSYTSSSSMSGTTSVMSRVRNGNITGFQTEVYAKPGDTVVWCNAYYPGVQKAYNATVTLTHPGHDTELSGLINSITNGPFSSLGWTNQFSITSVNVRPYYSESRSFGIGNSDPQSSSNSTSIGTDQVGQTLSETITSGYPSSVSAYSGVGPHTWGCHWKEEDKRCGIARYVRRQIGYIMPPDCRRRIDNKNPDSLCISYYPPKPKYKDFPVYDSCYVDTCKDSDLYYGYSQGGTASDKSYVYVPYNFRNTATVNIRDSLVYAGETMSIGSATVTVGGKQNDATQGFYATRVDNVQTKLVGYLSSSSTGAAKDNLNSSNICSALPVKNGSCNELNSYSGMTLNGGSSNMSGSTSALGFAGQSYNVYDAMAGDYYCVVAAVYPSTSGSDTNLAASGDGRWYVSAPSCRVIAKRPSFQVWGGSIYSARAVKTSNASKNNLWNVPGYGYATTDTRNTVIFGSWVEQSVVSNGIVTGLASGAATGDVADVRQTGSKESGANYCTYRVPLSIANWSTSTFGGSICPNVQAVGNAGLSNAAIDENSLMDYWNVSNASYINKTTINLASDYIETTTMQGNRVNYTEVAGNIYQASLTGATIRKGITHVVRTSGNLRIDGNIMYENATYRSQKEIPKLLIYASGNIVINCGVSRIDAIIIAGGQVKTCDSSNNNARANSNQLKVNGMIIADKLILNRSYGAWAGTGSGVPAEIINYDTSAIVWGKGMAAKSDFDTLTTVYQHEIAPRY